MFYLSISVVIPVNKASYGAVCAGILILASSCCDRQAAPAVEGAGFQGHLLRD